MGWKQSLFDQDIIEAGRADNIRGDSSNINTEVLPVDRLKNLEEKITAAVEKVKALKDEKTLLERKIKDLEAIVDEKNQEIHALKSEKSSIGSQLEELLGELETIEI